MTPAELARFVDDLDAWAGSRGAPSVTLAYGDHEDQVVELLGPDGADGPVVVVLHGGFWRAAFTRRTTRALATRFAEAGFATANVEYRRLGPGAWRPLLDDVRRARGRLDGFRRAVAVGHSAGGHLALWLAAEGLVDAAVTLGGVCDLEAAAVARLGDDAVVELLGGSPTEVPDAYHEADPAARLPLGCRQVLVHGTADDRVPIGHAARYAERAAAAGDECRLVELDADHFMPIDPRSSVWPTLLNVVSSLVRSADRAHPV
jgi:dipeptidyl aminopeptidase/acylaminoacyl peptidase